MGDVLFSTIEKFHEGHRWGRVLDAGTGVNSVKWMQQMISKSNLSLKNDFISFIAVTADENMKNQIVKDSSISASWRAKDQILVGNWMDDSFCNSIGSFDTIIADYLIGAVDGFSPYEQDSILGRMKDLLNPDGRLYLIGMNPIPDETVYPSTVISEVRRARDSCILLAGQRPYREYPLSWIRRQLQIKKMNVVANKNFTILHSEESTLRQLRVARSKLELLKFNPLRSGMDQYLSDLENRVKEAMKLYKRVPLSYDYVLAIEHSSDQTLTIEPDNELKTVFKKQTIS